MPGVTFTELSGLEAGFAGSRHVFVPAPGFVPCAAAGNEGRDGNQLRALVIEFAVIVGVPAVSADQYAKASCRGVDDVNRPVGTGLDKTALIERRIALTLGLADRQAVAAEHQRAVVQRAATGF